MTHKETQLQQHPQQHPQHRKGLGVAVLVIVAAITLPISRASAAAIAIPPTCADLASTNITTLSFTGAHHYLRLDPATAGPGSLGYRQFSDWVYKEPLLHAILSPVSPNGSFVADSYVWRPDYVVHTMHMSDDVVVCSEKAHTHARTHTHPHMCIYTHTHPPTRTHNTPPPPQFRDRQRCNMWTLTTLRCK